MNQYRRSYHEESFMNDTFQSIYLSHLFKYLFGTLSIEGEVTRPSRLRVIEKMHNFVLPLASLLAKLSGASYGSAMMSSVPQWCHLRLNCQGTSNSLWLSSTGCTIRFLWLESPKKWILQVSQNVAMCLLWIPGHTLVYADSCALMKIVQHRFVIE